MHTYNLDKWKCGLEPELHNSRAEKKTWFVIILTLFMMIAEIGAGTLFGSMALLADGWHMGTHAAALGISAFAYWYARKQKNNPKFTFGTGKVNVLGGYTSSTILIIVAILMIYESAERLFSPIEIHFEEAIAVAIIGLLVNLISALVLKDDHHHHGHHHHHHTGYDFDEPVRSFQAHSGHDHRDRNSFPKDDHDGIVESDHCHDHERDDHCGFDFKHPDHCSHVLPDHNHDETGPAHKDHNLRAAYIHVIADALTSVTAIIALSAGKYLGWIWMDPVMGIIGAGVIIRWGIGLAKDTGYILLDGDVHTEAYESVRQAIEADADNRIADLHLFKIGEQRMIGIMSIVTHYPRDVEHYKSLLAGIKNLAHVTVEVIACEGESCLPNTCPT